MKRISDKIREIEGFLEELKDVAPERFDEYKSSLTIKAACERYVEKIVEAATDLAFLAIKANKFRMPEDDADAFNVLLENKVIDAGMAEKMRRAKGMKNIIAHQYGKVDDEIVFDSVTEELGKDVKEFIGAVGKKPS